MRTVLTLKYYENFSSQELADALNLREGTVRNIIYQATKKLRLIMAKQGFKISTAVLPSLLNQIAADVEKIIIPSSLVLKLDSMVADTSAKSLSAASQKASSAFVLWPLSIAVILIGAAGFWRWNYTASPNEKIKSVPVTENNKNEELKLRQSVQNNAEHFFHRWTFENGLPADLEYFNNIKTGGSKEDWTPYIKNNKTLGMATPTNVRSFVDMPIELPVGNTRVAVKGQALNKSLSANFSIGLRHKGDSSRWIAPAPNIEEKSYLYETYFIADRWTISLINGELISIVRNDEASFSFHQKRFCFGFANVVLEEIAVQSVELNEIPEFIRDPKKLIENRGIKLTAVVPDRK